MLLDVKTAELKVLGALGVLPEEIFILAQARGRVLAEDIHAKRPYPPFDRATKDGISVLSTHIKKMEPGHIYKSETYAQAGMPQTTLGGPQNCIEVATGAPLPHGADCVIPYEDLEKTDAGFRVIEANISEGANLHHLGADIRKGDLLLTKGTMIEAPEITMLASNGVAEISVYKKPKIAIITTGDELLPLDTDAKPHQLYRSNDVMIAAVFEKGGFDVNFIRHVQDDFESTRAVIEEALKGSDIILITGGVSKGKYDFVPDALDDLEVQKILHRVAQRPGKPMWFGVSKTGVPVFGLPGNPVSALTCTLRYALPAVRKMSGIASDSHKKSFVELAEPIAFKPPLTYFAPVRIDEYNKAYPLPHNGSGDFMSLVDSDGFIELSADHKHFNAGEYYPFYSWRPGQ